MEKRKSDYLDQVPGEIFMSFGVFLLYRQNKH